MKKRPPKSLRVRPKRQFEAAGQSFGSLTDTLALQNRSLLNRFGSGRYDFRSRWADLIVAWCAVVVFVRGEDRIDKGL